MGAGGQRRAVIPARIKSGAATFPPNVFIDTPCTRVHTWFGSPAIMVDPSTKSLAKCKIKKKCYMTIAKEAVDKIASGK